MNLHPYDGIERRFRDTDPDAARGREVLLHVLGLRPDELRGPARYDLSFYSGGIGVLDRLAATIGFDAQVWSALLARGSFHDPAELARDPDEGESFRWLVMGEDESPDPHAAARAFIDEERAEFQPPCVPARELVFSTHSGVNDWSALWCAGEQIAFLAFSQG